MPQVAVAAGSKLAAEAGAAIAAGGGNAVDAAIAAIITSMCTDPGIVTPTAGGYLVIQAGGRPVVIDAYAEMPGRGADPDRLGNGSVVRMGYGGGLETIVGHGSVATPGAWAGLEEAWKRYGNAPWSELLMPAIDAVTRGFPLSTSAAHYMEYAHDLVFGWDPPSYAALHDVEGNPHSAGATIRVPDLADSLRALADEGAAALYMGDLGARIVDAVDAGGGLLTRADLASYRAIVRDALTVKVAGAQVATNPAPAVGGATMAAIALLAEREGFTSWEEPDSIEAMIAVQRTVLDYRRRKLTDIEQIPDGIRYLMETANLGALGDLVTSPSTTHTSTADSDGLACAITVSSGYGAGALPAGTGFWLNNCLGELELHPAGYHGLAPGTRLVSNMAPTTVSRSDGTIALGSPGADRITTAVASVLLNHLVAGMPLDAAIDHPRLHVEMFEGRPTIAVEPGVATGDIHDLLLRPFDDLAMYFGGVAAAQVTADGLVTAHVDPRRDGVAVVAGSKAS